MDSINKIWPEIYSSTNATPPAEYSSLLDYFTTTWNNARQSAQATTQLTREIGETLDPLASPPQTARLNTPLSGISRRALVDQLKARPDSGWRNIDETEPLNTLCLAFSLRLTLEIVPGAAAQDGYKLAWEDSSTISNVIEGSFPKSKDGPALASEQVDVRLTLEYLESYHGFQILFTNNLAEHLLLETIAGSK